jgi:hypothetical protein
VLANDSAAATDAARANAVVLNMDDSKRWGYLGATADCG